LRANGSRECAPDDRLRGAIQLWRRDTESWIASSQMLLAMTGKSPRSPDGANRNPGFSTALMEFLDCAEPVMGRRFAPTRWLHPGYSSLPSIRQLS
jgi:hypothetical protein